MFCTLILIGYIWIDPCRVAYLRQYNNRCYIGFIGTETQTNTKCKHVALLIKAAQERELD